MSGFEIGQVEGAILFLKYSEKEREENREVLERLAPAIVSSSELMILVEQMLTILPAEAIANQIGTMNTFVRSVFQEYPEAKGARAYVEGQLARSQLLRPITIEQTTITEQDALAELAVGALWTLAERAAGRRRVV